MLLFLKTTESYNKNHITDYPNDTCEIYKEDMLTFMLTYTYKLKKKTNFVSRLRNVTKWICVPGIICGETFIKNI